MSKFSTIASVALLAVSGVVFAEGAKPAADMKKTDMKMDAAKEVTLTGVLKCAKTADGMKDCMLTVEEKGKKTEYVLECPKSDCKDCCEDMAGMNGKMVQVTGTISTKDGKQCMTVTKCVEAKSAEAKSGKMEKTVSPNEHK